jgi:hypothetical protein
LSSSGQDALRGAEKKQTGVSAQGGNRGSAWLSPRGSIAYLIAAASILGAGTAWYASRASISADEFEREGFRQKAELVDAQVAVRESRQEWLFDYLRWLTSSNRANALAQLAEEGREVPASVRADIRTNREIARMAWEAIEPAARGDKTGRLALEDGTRVRLREIESTQRNDFDSLPEFGESNRLRSKENRLLSIAALLILSAVFFAVSQRWRTRAYRIPFCLGVAVLVGGTMAGLIVQFAT